MANQRMLENLYRLAYTDEIQMEDELQHHGVLDQRWGERHGPPYPLSGDNKREAEAAYKENRRQEREQRRQERAERRSQRMQYREAKRTDRINRKILRDAEKAQELERKKKKILDRANINEIKRNSKLFTSAEIEAAIKKRQLLDQTKHTHWKKKTLEKADLNAIKRHPELFTSEEMKTAIVRRELLDQQQNRKKSDVKKEREMAERMKKLETAAKIASSATTIIGLGKAGIQLVSEYKGLHSKDVTNADARFKTRYDALKQINKNIAIEEFNKYWNTSYDVSKSESRIDKINAKLETNVMAALRAGNKTDVDNALNQLKLINEIRNKQVKNEDKK